MSVILLEINVRNIKVSLKDIYTYIMYIEELLQF